MPSGQNSPERNQASPEVTISSHPDGKHPARRGTRYLLLTSLGALGIVYGDIGTSPLYAFRESFVAAEGLGVSHDSVFGVLSLMFWALILVVSLKYLVFVMRADNHGEGGILALTALLNPVSGVRQHKVKWALILIGLFGTALLYGDGMITPAISVLAAVEGLEIAAPGLEPYVIPIAVGILIGLFSIQKRGTSTVGSIFGPVMILWFAVLAALGISFVVGHPSIFGATNPWYAIQFLTDSPRYAFQALGAVFLVVTGSEALYADMGHFGKRPIRIGWVGVVFPALLLNYFGQGAMLIADPSTINNPFFRMPPEWAVLPLVILATMATVIASQALISGAYSLTMQAVQLGYLPRMKIDHTSPREIGQIYISSVNWALMVACVGLVLAFRSSTNLAAAYGVAVTTTMVITTILLFVVMRERWNWSLPVVIFLTSVFLTVDLAFFTANIVKVPAGGWFPLVIGAIVFTLMTTWRLGKRRVSAKIRRGELPIERFIGSIAAHPQVRVPGAAVYLFPDPGATPPALLANLRHNHVLHKTVALVAVHTARTPRVNKARRTAIHPLGEGFYQIVLTFGFMENPDVPTALGQIVDADFGVVAEETTYFLGRETVVNNSKGEAESLRTGLFAFMHRNASSAVQYFGLDPRRVVEFGSQVVM
ncbi:MAG: potassium transporter Kup [Acidimicrobiia bacterium]|nr:potassium transporter Kup [Acidimicrobiia bacterium]